MKQLRKLLLRLLIATLLLSALNALSACSSTRTEHGVTIENNNPLKFW